LAVLVAGGSLLVDTSPAAAEPAIPGLSVSGNVTFAGTSFVLTGGITVNPGGRLTIDNTTVLVRVTGDLDFGIRVLAGGELFIVNHSRITSTFASIAFSNHYGFFVEAGGHLVLQDSTIDGAFAFGVGDESAVIENATIANAIIGLYGWNLTVSDTRFLGNTVGFWLSGHSVLRNIEGRSNLLYAGMLEGTSRVEGGTFVDSRVADLQLFDNSHSENTTSSRSARGIIVNGDVSIANASVSGTLYGAVQLGDFDFGYGCGALLSIADVDELNLHDFPYFYRLNNTLEITDLQVDDPAGAIVSARLPWRRGMSFEDEANISTVCGDPPPGTPYPAEPLYNTVHWTVTRPTTVRAPRLDFNGSIDILPGGSLALEGMDLLFVSGGEPQRITAAGDSLSMHSVRLHSAYANYTSDLLEGGLARGPGVDIDIAAGSLAIADSSLHNLGTDGDLGVAAGLVVREGAGPATLSRTTIADSTRGVVLGCCAPEGASVGPALLDAVALVGASPLLELWHSNVSLVNTTLGNGSLVRSSAGPSVVSSFASDAAATGPGALTIERYGGLLTRVVWPDQRPVREASVLAIDTVEDVVKMNATTDAGGWTPFAFVQYSTSVWDGVAETSPSAHPFMIVASAANVSTQRYPVDVSTSATYTLVLPDIGSPLLSLHTPPVLFTGVGQGTLNGTVHDTETGVSLVEAAVDSGAFARVTPPGPPLEGPVNFSYGYAGLAPGIHVISVRAWDTVGNSALASAVVVVDPLPPNIFLDQAFNFTTNVRDFNLTGRLSEPGTVSYGNLTVVVPEDDLRFSLPFHLASDTEIVQLVVSDVAGNSRSQNVVVRLDQVPPQLTLTSPSDGDFVTRSDLLLQGTMEPTATIYLNGVRLNIGGQSSFSIPAVLSEGENALDLRAVDMAGNEATLEFTVFLDSGVPPLDVIGPDASRPLAHRDFEIVLRTEPGATVTIENTTVVADDPIVVVPYSLPDGRHTLSLQATDRAGNTVRRVMTVTIDTRVPFLSVSGAEGQRTSNETIRVIIQTEPGASVQVGQWVAQADDAGIFGLNVRLHPGENRIHIRAWDAAGNEAATVVSLTMEQPDAPQQAGFAAPGGASVVLLILGAVVLAVAAPIARRVARILP
jgi:hypothetical protein